MLNLKLIPTYCISLERSKERRANVAAECKRVGLSFKFFDAVDKNDLVLPELSFKWEGIDSEVKKSNALGALACMKSHVGALRKFLKTNERYVFIFEDDIKLCEDFNDRIGYISSIMQNDDFSFDILALGGHFPCDTPGDIGNHAESTRWTRMYRVSRLSGSYGYIVNRGVAEFIVRNATYNFGMDEFLSEHVYKRFIAFAFLPFPIGHKEGKSEITDVHWHYDNADWFYEQGEVDLKKEYLNHLIGDKELKKKQHDEQREAWLKANG